MKQYDREKLREESETFIRKSSRRGFVYGTLLVAGLSFATYLSSSIVNNFIQPKKVQKIEQILEYPTISERIISERIIKPNTEDYVSYKIKKGDTLHKLTMTYLGKTWKNIGSEVLKLNKSLDNKIENPDLIYPGDTIYFPRNERKVKGGYNITASKYRTIRPKLSKEMHNFSSLDDLANFGMRNHKLKLTNDPTKNFFLKHIRFKEKWDYKNHIKKLNGIKDNLIYRGRQYFIPDYNPDKIKVNLNLKKEVKTLAKSRGIKLNKQVVSKVEQWKNGRIMLVIRDAKTKRFKGYREI